MKMHQEIRMGQVLHMNTRMLESLSILQMSGRGLYEYLTREAVENPLISFDALERAEGRRTSKKMNVTWEQSFSQGAEWRAAPDSDSEGLKLQLSMLRCAPKEQQAGYFLIEGLDSRGYLPREGLDGAIGAFGPDVTYGALAQVQRLDPPGVGARDLRECLLLQLERMGARGGDEWAIVADHLEPLSRNQLPVIAQRLGISLQRVIRAVEKIRQLSPAPLGSGHTGYTPYIVPDLYILGEEGGFQIEINQIPPQALETPPEYHALAREKKDPEVAAYLAEHTSKVSHLHRCLGQRWETLSRAAGALAFAQQAFFLHGPGHLVPYSQKELAHEIKLSESTVCRAFKDKYIACEWGVFPGGYFFPQKAEPGENCSREDIVSALDTIIKEEDKRTPLSDQAIAAALKQRNFTLSRRTVTKYREQLGIPSSRLRRIYE